jgi:hypothetical protein
VSPLKCASYLHKNIGQDLDKDKMLEDLGKCLLGDREVAMGADKW